MGRTFEDLVSEAESVSVDGWDFTWLAGRATEQRPSWGYQRSMSARLAEATAALDIQTGGGEVLAGAPKLRNPNPFAANVIPTTRAPPPKPPVYTSSTSASNVSAWNSSISAP